MRILSSPSQTVSSPPLTVLKINPNTAQFFLEIGMHCLGCPSASGESIEQACEIHGVDADELVEKINTFLAEG